MPRAKDEKTRRKDGKEEIGGETIGTTPRAKEKERKEEKAPTARGKDVATMADRAAGSIGTKEAVETKTIGGTRTRRSRERTTRKKRKETSDQEITSREREV